MVKIGIIICLQRKNLELKVYQKEYQKKYREMKKTQGDLAKNAVLTP